MAPNAEDPLREKCVPAEPPKGISKPPPGDNVSETRLIIVTLFSEKIGLSSTQAPLPPLNTSSRKISLTLRRLTDDLIEKYQITFNGMYKSVNLEQQVVGINDMIKALAEQILHDDGFNWGRLITFISFVLYVAENLVRKGLANSEDVNAVAKYLSDYIDSELGTRLKQLGGWESLEVLFPQKLDYEKLVRNGLMGTVLGLGFFSVVRYLVQ